MSQVLSALPGMSTLRTHWTTSSLCNFAKMHHVGLLIILLLWIIYLHRKQTQCELQLKVVLQEIYQCKQEVQLIESRLAEAKASTLSYLWQQAGNKFLKSMESDIKAYQMP